MSTQRSYFTLKTVRNVCLKLATVTYCFSADVTLTMVRSKKGRKGKIQVGKKGTLEAEKKHESLKPCLRHLQYHLMLVYSEVRTSGTHSQRSMQDSTVGNVTSLKGRLILLSKNGGGKNTILLIHRCSLFFTIRCYPNKITKSMKQITKSIKQCCFSSLFCDTCIKKEQFQSQKKIKQLFIAV